VALGFELKTFALARQVLYYLNHTPTTFCFSYFSGKVSCFFVQISLDLYLLCSRDYRRAPPYLAYIVEIGSH
jgi:hypothetical protein